jgi:hypothetical protein
MPKIQTLVRFCRHKHCVFLIHLHVSFVIQRPRACQVQLKLQPPGTEVCAPRILQATTAGLQLSHTHEVQAV